MSYAKRYFFTFYSIDTQDTTDQVDLFTCEIHQLDYVGDAEEIQAQKNPVTVDYPNTSKSKLSPLRSSRALLRLIADGVLELSDLYSENERTWLLKVFRAPLQVEADTYLFWQGFVLPDECSEEFSFAPYPLEVNAVDGIGVLKNLSFVNESGTPFAGKMSFKDVIWNCLNRLQIPGMTLNTATNIYYDGLTPDPATDPLSETFINAERYTKDQDDTPMTCEEVLKSVLEEWTSCIVQMNGNWYVYRPNELAVSGTVTFRQYSSVDGSYTGTETLSIDSIIGGSSEGELIYHTDRSQRKSISRPYKNASISYKYGLVASVIENPNFDGWDGTGFPGWVKTDPAVTVEEDPDGGAKLGPADPFNGLKNSTPYAALAGEMFAVIVDYYNYNATNAIIQVVLIGTSTYYLTGAGTWQTTQDIVFGPANDFAEGTLSVNTQPIPINGNIEIRLIADPSLVPPPDSFMTYRSANLRPVVNSTEAIGEIHIIKQAGVFTYIPEIVNVFNGDASSEQYLGAIYKNDEDTLTSTWSRAGMAESKPFLRIAAEEMLRIHQRPMNVYDGTVSGFFQYLTRFAINDMPGVFLPVQLSYDLQESTINATLSEVSNDELTIEYELIPDYGSVTKVSINEI